MSLHSGHRPKVGDHAVIMDVSDLDPDSALPHPQKINFLKEGRSSHTPVFLQVWLFIAQLVNSGLFKLKKKNLSLEHNLSGQLISIRSLF